jgi:hypothetical protein
LGGAAGETIGNQSAGLALIAMVISEFDLNVLYQTKPEVAIAELNRIAKINRLCH